MGADRPSFASVVMWRDVFAVWYNAMLACASCIDLPASSKLSINTVRPICRPWANVRRISLTLRHAVATKLKFHGAIFFLARNWSRVDYNSVTNTDSCSAVNICRKMTTARSPWEFKAHSNNAMGKRKVSKVKKTCSRRYGNSRAIWDPAFTPAN